MKIDDKIRGEKLQIISLEEPRKYSHCMKINYTNYSCTEIVKLNYTNYLVGNSN